MTLRRMTKPARIVALLSVLAVTHTRERNGERERDLRPLPARLPGPASERPRPERRHPIC